MTTNIPTIQLDWETNLDENYGSEEEDSEIVTRNKIRKKIKEKYPFLNEEQVDFILILDFSIKNAVPQIKLPQLKLSNVMKNMERKRFFELLRIPILIFLINISMAIAVVLTNNSLIVQIYPYFVTWVTFIASVPSIKSMYMEYFYKASSAIHFVKGRVEPAIDRLEVKATDFIRLARCELNKFIQSARAQLLLVEKAKASLKHMDLERFDGTKTPDVLDLEGYLDEKEIAIHQVIVNAKSSLELQQYVPWILRYDRNFILAVLFPVLLVKLSVQLFATWQTEATFELLIENQWESVIVCIQTFLISLVQISLAFLASSIQRMIGFINRRIKAMNETVNQYLENKAIDTFHLVLDIYMTEIKERVIHLVCHIRHFQVVVLKAQGVAHEVVNASLVAKNMAAAVETKFTEVAQVENHTSTKWLKIVHEFLSFLSEKIDTCTAGLMNCN